MSSARTTCIQQTNKPTAVRPPHTSPAIVPKNPKLNQSK